MASRDLSNAIVASPNQASTIFGVGGGHPIRSKSLFLMRFLRRVGEGGEDWKNGMSFLVKSMDRPSVQPTTEEINQYNRKRIIHTGVKYQPVTCTIYDTADGAAQMLWAQYASYYFGDYRQEPASYGDDIINERMNDPTRAGYGYGIASTTASEPLGINSQFFFEKVEVFQVWGGEYTAYQLVNPKITNFAPDDLDYEQNTPSMVSLTIQYESIYHENGGKSSLISGNETLTELFGGQFNGETYDPANSATRAANFTSAPALPNKNTESEVARLLAQNNGANTVALDTVSTPTSSGGSLSRFGTFNFGDFNSLGSNLPSELSSLVSNRDSTQAALRGNLGNIPDVADGINRAASAEGNSPLDHTLYDDNGILAGRYFAFDLPLDGDMPAPAPTDAVVYSPSTPRQQGLSLSPVVLAAVNSRSDGTSQLGQRVPSQMGSLGFVKEPTPAPNLQPSLLYGRIRSKIVPTRSMFGTILPPTILGTISRNLSININADGTSPPVGFVDDNVVVTSDINSTVYPTGDIARSTVVTCAARGYTQVSGSVSASVIVKTAIKAKLSIAGLVSANANINSSIIGRVVVLRGALDPSISITSNIVGNIQPFGFVNSSVPIVSNSLAAITNTSTISKEITISIAANGGFYPYRAGSINKSINISSNIRARTSWGTIGYSVIITPDIDGNMEQAGFIATAPTILSNAQGYSLSGFIDTNVVVQADVQAYSLFGTSNTTIIIAADVDAFAWPTGWVDSGVVVSSSVNTLVAPAGQISQDVVISSQIIGVKFTAATILSGSANNSGTDTLLLSGDATDGDDELYYSGDF